MIDILLQVDTSQWKEISDTLLAIVGDWWAFSLPILAIFFPKVRQLTGNLLVASGTALTPKKYKDEK